jgi:hypothetical protein
MQADSSRLKQYGSNPTSPLVSEPAVASTVVDPEQPSINGF